MFESWKDAADTDARTPFPQVQESDYETHWMMVDVVGTSAIHSRTL